MKTGKGRNATRALVLTSKVHNPKRVDKFSEVLPSFENWECYVKECERDAGTKMAEVTKMNSLRQLVPKELEIDMTWLTHLDTWAAMKKCVLDQVVVRREPYFNSGVNTRTKDPAHVPWTSGTSTTRIRTAPAATRPRGTSRPTWTSRS